MLNLGGDSLKSAGLEPLFVSFIPMGRTESTEDI